MPTSLDGKSTCIVTGAGAAGAADVGDVGVGDSPAVLDEQVDGQLGRRGRQRRVDAALEAARGLAGQLVPAGRAGDGDRLEVRGLDEHVAGRRTDLGLAAAHDAGDRDGAIAAVVGDEQVARVEGTLDVVEGRQPLAGARTAHDDRALEGGEVEGVQRLAEAEHHVVRDVDRQRDRAHPGLGEAHRHPARGRRRDVDAAHDACDVAVAAGAAADRVGVGAARPGSRRRWRAVPSPPGRAPGR